MRTILLAISLLQILCTSATHAQSTCNNPTNLDICPSVLLTNETNAGKGDDASAPCNLLGEDVVYKVNAPNGAQSVFISIQNASGPYFVFLRESDCITGVCHARNGNAGNASYAINLTNPTTITTLFLSIDAATSITYDLSIGADTGSVWISQPNLLGNLQLDSSGCASPLFSPAKPFFQVTYNGTPQINPMTLAPLGVPGNLCVTTFFKNTTGLQGVKEFQFKFNPAGFSSVTGQPSFPGYYNLGTWNRFGSGVNWNYMFSDIAPLNRGDFTGFPNTCLSYEFCFTIIPISNDPQLTNVDVKIYSDGFGAPVNGYLALGCCPVPFTNCIGSGLGATSASGSFGFGFADPGGSLPIELLDFTVTNLDDDVKVNWSTATEINNDYFLLQRSQNGSDWEDLQFIDGAGNSTSIIKYEYIDINPLKGTSFYRLKQVDFDGKSSLSEVVKIKTGNDPEVLIYPNPAKDYIIIEKYNADNIIISLHDLTGRSYQLSSKTEGNTEKLQLNNLASGLYFIVVQSDGVILKNEKIIIQ